MNDNRLEDLLNAPLAPVADNGFSARVLVRARLERVKAQALFFAALVLCAIAALFVPLPPIAATMVYFLTKTATFPAVSLAVGALVLTFTVERALAQR
jgi:hypothetical protein